MQTFIMILPQTFYEQDTITVAKRLLGCYLVHLEGEETTLGRIVETEAYLVHDPAAHSFIGKTKRNSPRVAQRDVHPKRSGSRTSFVAFIAFA